MAKISHRYDESIAFEDGTAISAWHNQESCTHNYPDFTELDTEALDYDFDTKHLIFKRADFGFRFGDNPLRMFFVPCYSEQNGYYTDMVNITCNGKDVLKGVECDTIIY